MSDWCGEVKVGEEPTEKYEYLSEVLTRGGTLKLFNRLYEDSDSEGEWVTLTLSKLLQALGDFDFEDYDAINADTVVQKAVFGEVIYG